MVELSIVSRLSQLIGSYLALFLKSYGAVSSGGNISAGGLETTVRGDPIEIGV